MDETVIYSKVNKLEKEVVKLQTDITKINKIVDLEATTDFISNNGEIEFKMNLGLDTNRMIINLIYIESLSEYGMVECEVRSNSFENGYFVYYKNNITNKLLYDQVNIPFIDDSNTDTLYLWIKNNSEVRSKYKVRIIGTQAF